MKTQPADRRRAARAIKDPLVQLALGHELAEAHQFAEAEVKFRGALAINSNLPMAHNNLGWTRQKQGDFTGAIVHYKRAIELNGSLRLAQLNLALLLCEIGRFEEAKFILRALAVANPDDRKLLDKAIGIALRAGQLQSAASYATEYAALCRGSKWYNPQIKVALPVPSVPSPTPVLTVAKLRHDIAQFQYLQQRGLLGLEFTEIAANYQRLVDRLLQPDNKVRQKLKSTERDLVKHVYGRIVHVRETSNVGRALSQTWDAGDVEDQYLAHPLGLAVIDDFLSKEALQELRQFCLESTIWFTNRYAHGRLGAFFREGFNTAILVQVADELRASLPRVIGESYPPLQLWAFKYNHLQPSTSAHADFAAVNVNFWLTPDEANLDVGSGGLVVYDVEAPRNWNFDSYNRQSNKIDALLRENRARTINIPYRANRAVIFNSDLFHATAPVRFRPGYENHRINVTILYGKREQAFRVHTLAAIQRRDGAG